MRVAIGNDHGGYPLRGPLLDLLHSLAHEVVDFGIAEEQAVDYPEYAAKVGRAVRDNEADLGIVLCGTGIGSAIAANKIAGVYAALCHDTFSSRMARSHNAANVIAMGARVIGSELAKEILQVFLATQPSPEARHQRRRQQVYALERGLKA